MHSWAGSCREWLRSTLADSSGEFGHWRVGKSSFSLVLRPIPIRSWKWVWQWGWNQWCHCQKWRSMFLQQSIQAYGGQAVLMIIIGALSMVMLVNLGITVCHLSIYRCLWLSNTLFILLLSSSWVFAMLYVNVYALDSVILGWVFMACSTCLVSLSEGVNLTPWAVHNINIIFLGRVYTSLSLLSL